MNTSTKVVIAVAVVIAIGASYMILKGKHTAKNADMVTAPTKTDTNASGGASLRAKQDTAKMPKKSIALHEKKATEVNDAEIKRYVEAIVPTEEELTGLKKDARYGPGGFEHGVREMLEHHFGKGFDETRLQEMIASGIRSAYRSDKLADQYAYKEIDGEFLRKALMEDMFLLDAEYQVALTDKEYEKMFDVPKGQSRQTITEMHTRSPDEQFLGAFPEILKGNDSIKTVDELGIDEVVINDLLEMSEEHHRLQMRTNIQVENGEVNLETGNAIFEQNELSYRNYIASILTPEQGDIILGENWRQKREKANEWVRNNITETEFDDEEFDDTPIVEGSEEWNDLIAEGATPEGIREFNETGVLEIIPKEQK